MTVVGFLSVFKVWERIGKIGKRHLPLPSMIKLAVGLSECKLQQLLASLDLSNKVKVGDSRITPGAAEDRW